MSSIEDEVSRLVSPYNIESLKQLSLSYLESEYMQKRDELVSSYHQSFPRRINARTGSEILEIAFELSKDVNEILAFHGTTSSAASSIAKYGFDLSRSKQCGLFGTGIYLSDSISKAMQYTNHSDKKILVCRVLMGKPKVYLRRISDPRIPENYDSILGIRPKTVNILDQYKEFVVFDPKQVLPLFLIEIT